jgi:hypothetical protein
VFAVDAAFTHLAARREQVLVLIQSINALSVKVPGFPTSPAMGYYVGWDVGSGNASAAIYLHLSAKDQSVAYLHDPRTFPLTQLPGVTAEAVEFLESMGFMVDDAAYGTLRPEEQVALMERTPLFHADLARFSVSRHGEGSDEAGAVQAIAAPTTAEAPAAPETAAVTPSQRAQAIGRLLMTF